MSFDSSLVFSSGGQVGLEEIDSVDSRAFYNEILFIKR